MEHQLVVDLLYPQLSKVEQKMRREFKLRNGTILDYVSIPSNNTVEYYLPALLVLIFGNTEHADEKKVLGMSSVVEFIFLGTKTHYQVDDTEEDSAQFPILIGDYLYGQFYVALCDIDCLNFLSPLSHCIESIHQAGIREWQMKSYNTTKDRMFDIFEQKWGDFFGLSCGIGCTLSNKSVSEVNYATSIGKAIGCLYGAINYRPVNQDWIEDIKENVVRLIQGINDPFIKKTLTSLVSQLLYDNTNNQQYMVG